MAKKTKPEDKYVPQLVLWTQGAAILVGLLVIWAAFKSIKRASGCDCGEECCR